MSESTYTMSVIIERGRYSDRERMFASVADVVLLPEHDFEVEKAEAEHELTIYDIPDHPAVLDLLEKLLAVQAEFRDKNPTSRTHFVVATWVDRDDEENEDPHTT